MSKFKIKILEADKNFIISKKDFSLMETGDMGIGWNGGFFHGTLEEAVQQRKKCMTSKDFFKVTEIFFVGSTAFLLIQSNRSPSPSGWLEQIWEMGETEMDG